MKTLLEKTKYLAFIPVFSALSACVAVFVYGAFKTIETVVALVSSSGDSSAVVVVSFIKLMDILLIGTALLIFAVGLYELFIADLDLPAWLVIHDLQALKAKLSQVVILVMGITFLEHLVEWQNAGEALLFGLGIGVVSLALIASTRDSGHA